MKTQTLCFLLLILLVFSLLTPSSIARSAGIFYVKPDGIGDCSSWANACMLQTALTNAVSGDEIWVAAGTHKPTVGTDRSATFQLKNGVVLYGGFAGTETVLTQRNPKVNVTILSGDLNGDDVGLTNNSENVYHVVYGASGATLDGFTIRGGNANSSWPDDYGGGMYNGYASPTITNVTFDGNWGIKGGGIGNYYSSPTITNVTFIGNSGNSGGGIYNYHGSLTLTDVTFSSNSATSGGGMASYLSDDPLLLTNVTFNANSASNGGGIWNSWVYDFSLKNGTFSGNSADYGGGIYSGYSYQGIQNTIFWENTAAVSGPQIYLSYYTVSVYDSVVQGGCPEGTGCSNIITGDPLLGPLGDYGGFTQTIPLLTGSSAIDAGNNATCATTDQRGVTRPQGAYCDIGAYEVLDTIAPIVSSITRVNPSSTSLASVDFTVTFSKTVTGVDTDDFTLTASGVTGASITSVSGGPIIYTVSVNTGSGSGTIRLDVPASAAISDLSGNPLADLPYTSGETYTVRIYRTYLPLVIK